MALGFRKQPDPEDPRLKAQRTEYQASRGGWYPPKAKPVPGTPKTPKK